MSDAPHMAESRAQGETEAATPHEIDALIRDLEDPEQRATLVRGLKVFRKARTEADPEPQPLAEVDMSSLLDNAGEVLESWLAALLRVDAY